jgi:hypothetical protein
MINAFADSLFAARSKPVANDSGAEGKKSALKKQLYLDRTIAAKLSHTIFHQNIWKQRMTFFPLDTRLLHFATHITTPASNSSGLSCSVQGSG